MQVLILATDEQQPLPPLTDTLPAAMLPVVDRPVLATTVEILARAGYKQVLISLHERGGQIASYFGDGQRWGLEIKYLTQRQALGSAGSVRFAGSLLNQTVLVLPGDTLIDLDIEAAVAFHRLHRGIATAILHPPRSPDTAGTLSVGADGRLLPAGVDEPDSYRMRPTQAFILEPAVLDSIPRGEPFDLTRDLLPALLAAGEAVYGYTMHGYWNALDSVAAFQDAQEVYLYSAYRQRAPGQEVGGPAEEVRFPSIEARQVAPGIWVGRDHSIHPTVKLAAPTYIGANSWIGREVELGPATVIGANVVIDDEATVGRSTVLPHTYVGRLVHVVERVVTPSSITDVASGESLRIVDPFLIGPVDVTPTGPGLPTRVVGTLAALGLILLLAPLLLLVGLLVLFTTGGLLVRLPRVGERATDSAALRSFQLLRFRTRWASGDPTLLGPILERWELHRLPELFNVLRGDMALVGVKPLLMEEAAYLTEEWHQRRHETPVGFTGLWYLQTGLDSSLDAVIVTDVYYTATRSWRGDLLCLLRTPYAWFRRTQGGVKDGGESDYLVQAG